MINYFDYFRVAWKTALIKGDAALQERTFTRCNTHNFPPPIEPNRSQSAQLSPVGRSRMISRRFIVEP